MSVTISDLVTEAIADTCRLHTDPLPSLLTLQSTVELK